MILTKENINSEMQRTLDAVPESLDKSKLAFAMNRNTKQLYESVNGNHWFKGMQIIEAPGGMPDNTFFISTEQGIMEAVQNYYALQVIQND